jgi:hypothetical protein
MTIQSAVNKPMSNIGEQIEIAMSIISSITLNPNALNQDMDKTEWIRLESLMDTDRQPSLQVVPKIFHLQGWMTRGVDQVPHRLMPFRAIENLMSLKEPAYKTMFWTLLKFQALKYFEHHLRRSLEVEYSELPDIELKKLLTRELYIGS